MVPSLKVLTSRVLGAYPARVPWVMYTKNNINQLDKNALIPWYKRASNHPRYNSNSNFRKLANTVRQKQYTNNKKKFQAGTLNPNSNAHRQLIKTYFEMFARIMRNTRNTNFRPDLIKVRQNTINHFNKTMSHSIKNKQKINKIMKVLITQSTPSGIYLNVTNRANRAAKVYYTRRSGGPKHRNVF